MKMENEKFICAVGITSEERQKLKELVELCKTKYNLPKATVTKVVQGLLERIDEFSMHKLKTPVKNGNFSILKLYIDTEETFIKLNQAMLHTMRDKSNLVRWLINVAYEIEICD